MGYVLRPKFRVFNHGVSSEVVFEGYAIQNSKSENARRLDKAESIISFVCSSAAVAIVESCHQILYPKEEHSRCLVKIPLFEANICCTSELWQRN